MTARSIPRTRTLAAIASAARWIKKLPPDVRYVLTVMDDTWVELDIAALSDVSYWAVAELCQTQPTTSRVEVQRKTAGLVITLYRESIPCTIPPPSHPSKISRRARYDGAISGCPTESPDESPSPLQWAKLSIPLSKLI